MAELMMGDLRASNGWQFFARSLPSHIHPVVVVVRAHHSQSLSAAAAFIHSSADWLRSIHPFGCSSFKPSNNITSIPVSQF